MTIRDASTGADQTSASLPPPEDGRMYLRRSHVARLAETNPGGHVVFHGVAVRFNTAYGCRVVDHPVAEA